ncbi:unnamed protein product [Brachionus calyciflorus]|uniref:Uncharacterized protein n=1 Tax=Brachionus calyciflorus TaxID=104777 RepID=A0A814HJT1_9BILA|nr:unnamed protein product [Brachionus calyciflorus]
MNFSFKKTPVKYIQVENKDDFDKSIELTDEESEIERAWYNYTYNEKVKFIFLSILKILLFLLLLYLFLLSLNFMTIGFSLVSPYALKASNIIQFMLKNPLSGLALGVLITALLQNATATTSIAVSMVGAGIIPSVKSAIPIIMGSNIGTCVTNSFIALTLSGDPNEFKRAFSAATLNDIFNYLTTAVLITLDILFDFLLVLSEKLTDLMPEDSEALKKANFIGEILHPISSNSTEIALRCCSKEIFFNINSTLSYQTVCLECTYLSFPMIKNFGDGLTGLFWIVLSLITLIACLFGIVKILSLIIIGPIAQFVRKIINASFPGKLKWLTQIALFIVAFLLTLIVQSSNIITATLVPLCGMGMVSLQRVYVMTLGSNIGTTLTGILSAFTQPASSVKKSLQLAFIYSLFNIFGVILWLPIKSLRFPKTVANKLGNVIFKYKWFLYVYVLGAYFVIPLIIFGLALIPYWIGLAIFGIPIIIFILFCLIIEILKKYGMVLVPEKLKNYDWLPIGLRSMEYWDLKIKNMKFSSKDSVENEDIFIPEMIRRFSTINSVIKEARIYKRKNTIAMDLDSSFDDYELDLTTIGNQSIKKF